MQMYRTDRSKEKTVGKENRRVSVIWANDDGTTYGVLVRAGRKDLWFSRIFGFRPLIW